ncbi:MAG: glycosyltransferase family 2 protein [Candidatus Omnitrophica bacterium]|nr:glycosyltransferase family 2 protein [Candidatus Omnitrophota bacterium]
MRICVVIPVHDEAATIGNLVQEIRCKSLDVVVIDDGSADDSGKIAEEKGAVIIHHCEKLGKGVSLRDGFAYAVDNGYDGVVAMDGDGQHAVCEIDSFIQIAKQHSESIVSGSRMKNCDNMPLIRRLTNQAMSSLISAICRQKVPDSQCGFRYISTKILKVIKLSSSDFEIETEVLIKASRKGFKIYSIPVQSIYRNELSKINPFIDTIRFFIFIIKQVWCL